MRFLGEAAFPLQEGGSGQFVHPFISIRLDAEAAFLGADGNRAHRAFGVLGAGRAEEEAFRFVGLGQLVDERVQLLGFAVFLK